MTAEAYILAVIYLKKAVIYPPTGLLAAVLFVYCLFNSHAVAEGSRAYLRLCGERVVPALFVFSALSALVCRSRLFYRLCGIFPYFGTELALIIMGMLGGFPLGASVAVQLYDSGRISKRQGEYLCAFTNNPSVAFVVSYVGGVLGDTRTGILLALLVFGSAVICALALKPIMLKGDERVLRLSDTNPTPLQPAAALRECSTTMVLICGCIVFFGGVGALVPQSVRGLLELSGGVADCRSPVEAAVLLGFSGVCVCFQVAAICADRLSAMPYFAAKLMQSAIMGVGAYFLFD